MSDTIKVTEPTEVVAKPYRWQITLDPEGAVKIDVGDAFPSNDSRAEGGLGLTANSYLALTYHSISETLHKLASNLAANAVSIGQDDDDYYDNDDDED